MFPVMCVSVSECLCKCALTLFTSIPIEDPVYHLQSIQ